MATLLCESNINFTASSWKVVDSGSATLVETSSAATGTSYASGANFTPGAITVEGIILSIRGVINNSGTLRCELYNATGSSSVAGTEVEINVSDLNSLSNSVGATNAIGGAFYVKFSSPVTLSAATNYNVRVKTSVANTVYLHVVSGTNWAKGIVTSTTAAPGASDDLYVLGPFTGTVTPTTIICTMNNTASTTFGSFQVSGFGKVVLENNASTNYILSIANGGSYKNYTNGRTEFGTSSSRIQSTSSMLLELKSSSAAGNSLSIRSPSSFKMYGATKTRRAKLAANASAGATSLTTDVSTGWLNGDNIALANTTRTAANFDRKALTANASGTTLTITAIATAKEGTAPVQADLGNLTSNAKVYGTSATNTCYVAGDEFSNRGGYEIEVDQVEFRYFGSATSGKLGFSVNGPNDNIIVNNCTFHDGHTSSKTLYAGTGYKNFTFTNNIMYSGSYGFDLVVGSSISTAANFNNNLLIGYTAIGIALGRSTVFDSTTTSVQVNNNTVSGCATGVSTSSRAWNPDGTNFTGNIAYGCYPSYGFMISSANGSFGTITAYRCSYGLFVNYGASLSIENFVSFGCTTAAFATLASGVAANMYFKSATINAGTGEAAPRGITLNGAYPNLTFANFEIGTTTTHSAADIFIGTNTSGNITFIDGNFGSTTLIQSPTLLDKSSFISIQKNGETSGQDFSYGPYGTVSNDSTIYDTSSRSLRLTPSSATISQTAPLFSANIPSGQSATLKVKVRKSVAGDGAAYNGTMQPKIWMKANAAAGSSFDVDTLMATATAASDGAWEELTLSVPTVSDNTAVSFYLEAIGTAGWVNVDSVSEA